MTKATVVVLDRIGYNDYKLADGTPIIDPECYEVHVLSMLGVTNLAKDINVASQHVINLMDDTQVTDLLDDINREFGIDYIVSLDEEHLVQCAELRELYGCYGRSPQDIVVFRDKVKMKTALKSNVTLPTFCELEGYGDAMGFISRYGKSVIKPIEGLGSERTYVVHNAIDLRLQLASKNIRWSDYEIEQYIDGTMYHIDAVIENNRLVSHSISQYVTSTMDYAQGLPLMAVTIDRSHSVYAKATALLQIIIETLPIGNGVVHLEAFDTSAEALTFCEVAIRPGGGGVRSQVLAATGVDLFAVYLRQELGDDIEELIPENAEVKSGYILFPPQSGKVANVSRLEEFNDDWIVHKKIFATQGDQLADNTCCLGKAALFCVVADSDELLVDRVLDIKERFKLEVSSGCCA